MDKSVISGAAMVAGGRFAPGHLGELTQQVPFEMIDAVLAETCRVDFRPPASVVVYLLLAGCLFAELGYSQVWQRMAAGLGALPVAAPAPSAMTQARRRLGRARCASCSSCCAARPRTRPGGRACSCAPSTAPS